MSPLRITTLIVAVTLVAPALARGEDEVGDGDRWGLCAPLRLLGDIPTGTRSPGGDAPTLLQADEVETVGDQSRLSGNAIIEQGGQRLESEELIYNAATTDFRSDAPLRYRSEEMALNAERAQINLADETGLLELVEFAIAGEHARGGAARIGLEGPDRRRLTDFTYTTCNESAEAWRLRGGEIVLDDAEGFGTAYNTRLEIGPVPVFYFPYLKFPITDRRMSGFLFPAVGSSSNLGTEIRIPYYLNLAPNRDMTLTPRLLTRRGLLLETEYRYLTRRGDGSATLDYLPSDEEYGDRDRALLVYRQTSRWPSGWSTDAGVEYASDKDYFDDLGETLSVSSTTHLEQRAALNYAGRYWSFRGRLQAFQTVDRDIAPADEPYRRLPQLTLATRRPWEAAGWQAGLGSEWVRFDHASEERGDRAHFAPTVAYPLSRTWGYLTPRLTLRETRYRLSDRAAGLPTDPERSLYTLSVDSGLVLERPVTLGGSRFTQTLEPRLFYLRTPFEEQSQLPLFDTTEPDFSFASLWRDNRFSGVDRVGDADQLSIALTTRLLDDATGRERVAASIGQIRYFRDRRVQLTGTAVDTADHSDIVGEITAALPNHWRATAEVQWDPDDGRANRNSLRFQYRRNNEHIFNVTYRFQRDELEQGDLSFRWPLGARWRGVGRWNYSLRDSRDLETFFGVEYESCCWAVGLVWRRFLNDDDGEYNDSVMAQIRLKGLGRGSGNKIEGLLERGILGYRQDP